MQSDHIGAYQQATQGAVADFALHEMSGIDVS
jgi:hypothetical protein